MPPKELASWIQKAKEKKLSDEEIKRRLTDQGWDDEQIDAALHNLVSKIPRGTDRLAASKKHQIYQKIILGWLIGYIILRILYLVLFSAIDPSVFFVVLYSSIFVAPGVIVLWGIVKVKPWAYWFYGLALFGSLTSFLDVTIGRTLGFVIFGVVMTIVSIIVLVLIFKLYSYVFPSTARLSRERAQQG